MFVQAMGNALNKTSVVAMQGSQVINVKIWFSTWNVITYWQVTLMFVQETESALALILVNVMLDTQVSNAKILDSALQVTCNLRNH